MSNKGLPEGFEFIDVKPEMDDVIAGVAEIALLLRPENGVGSELTERDKAKGVLVSELNADDYRKYAGKYENFFAVREIATDKIVAFRWLYGPNDQPDEWDQGSNLIRKLFGAVYIGKQIGTHPDYRGLYLGTALVDHTMRKLKTDVYNVILNANDASLTVHNKLGYEPLHTFEAKGYTRTIFVKRYDPALHFDNAAVEIVGQTTTPVRDTASLTRAASDPALEPGGGKTGA